MSGVGSSAKTGSTKEVAGIFSGGWTFMVNSTGSFLTVGPMIFRRSILAEIVQNAAMTAFGLLAVALTVLVVRLVGEAAMGDIPADLVWTFLGLLSSASLMLLLYYFNFH